MPPSYRKLRCTQQLSQEPNSALFNISEALSTTQGNKTLVTIVHSCILQTERLRPCEKEVGGVILSILASFSRYIN